MDTANDIQDLEGLARQAETDSDLNLDDLGADFEQSQAREGEFIPGAINPDAMDMAKAAFIVDIGQTVFRVAHARYYKKRGVEVEPFILNDLEKSILLEPVAQIVAQNDGVMPDWMIPYKPWVDLGFGFFAIWGLRAGASEAEQQAGAANQGNNAEPGHQQAQ